MVLSKVYMLEILNRFMKYLYFLFFCAFIFSSCSSKPETKTVKTTLKKEIKQLKTVKRSKPVLPQVNIDTILVKDIITHKNVKSFFLDYGKKNPETKLLLKTRLGDIHITLYKQTPLHRASFIYLIKNGYYNKTCFHRIVKDFIIQAGSSELAIVDRYRNQLNNYRLPAEFRKGVIHKRGALSAARRWVNNPYKMSSPFEFFIMQTSIDCSHLNFEHTVFGQVTKGFNVIDKIADVTLDGYSEWPEVDIDVEFVILK